LGGTKSEERGERSEKREAGEKIKEVARDFIKKLC